MKSIVLVMVVVTAGVGRVHEVYGVVSPATKLGAPLPSVANIEEMTLEQAIALALVHSPKMKEAQATLRLATIDVAEARLENQLWPTLSLGRRFDGVSDKDRLGLAVSLDLVKVFGAGRETERAKLKRFNAEVYTETVKAQVIEEVSRAFFSYQLARQTVGVHKTAHDGQVKLAEVVRIRFEAGKADIENLLAVGATMDKEKLAALQAEQEEQLALLHLSTVVGLPMKVYGNDVSNTKWSAR